MGMRQLDTESGDFDLTSTQTVLTYAVTAITKVQGVLFIGGTKARAGAVEDWELTMTVTIGADEYVVEPGPQTDEWQNNTKSSKFTNFAVVPSGATVKIKLKSPNGADTDVDVIAYLYDVGPLQPVTQGRDVDVDASGDVTAENMRGTDSAALAASYTAPRAALLDNLDAAVSTRSDFNESTDEVDIGAVKGVGVTNVDDFKSDATLANQTALAAATDLIQGMLGAHNGGTIVETTEDTVYTFDTPLGQTITLTKVGNTFTAVVT